MGSWLTFIFLKTCSILCLLKAHLFLLSVSTGALFFIRCWPRNYSLPNMDGFQCKIEDGDSLYIVDKLVHYEYIINTLISRYFSIPFN